ncbi:CoA transferase, partial [Mycolicibacter sinensis]|uniref:CoA transferase n=1 Tax=Mycolicibacter sinensis (strain JDM601) TaxID=875328 RepID=UPI000AA26B6F
MPGVMDGIRVIELATWGFIPSAGVALADWGAEVIKIEHPVHGDPMRGLVSGSLASAGQQPVPFMFETFSRNKSSVGIDLTTESGREALLRLVATADVFLTNYLEPVRKKLRIDVDELLTVNPRLVYARGSGLGPKGAESGTGGFDLASYWSRGGVGHVSTEAGGGGAPPPARCRRGGPRKGGCWARGGGGGGVGAGPPPGGGGRKQ